MDELDIRASKSQSKSQQTARCSLCEKPFDRSASKSFPFCSPRCRQIDLGNWLNESYGLPVEDGGFDGSTDEEF